MIPRATYRIQFHKAFPFARARDLAGYFQELGISHVYSSPILKARAGSLHGYDVIDHSCVNPELGGEEGYREMVGELRRHGLGIIVDIVPNHMAVGGADNLRWLDVLKNGRASPYADFFDIDWNAPGLEGKVFAPFLDGTARDCIAKGDLTLERPETGDVAFAYFAHRFPLRADDQRAWEADEPAQLSESALLDILSKQHFVLADWREANTKINWRRFFDVTGLAALRADKEAVFEATHAKILSLYAEDLIDGLRVDHIDGLADPRAYCRKLRECLDAARATESGRDRAYIVIEKILASREEIPSDWNVDGTTGYDFMNDVSALLHAPDETQSLSRAWAAVSGRSASFEPEERLARGELLGRDFASQSAMLLRRILAAASALGLEIEEQFARDAVAAIIVNLRCYRTYATGRADSPPLGTHFDDAVQAARERNPHLAPALATIVAVLSDRSDRDEVIEAVRASNQLSAPIAAKAVEDTAFYRYGRILSRNDVGFDPALQQLAIDEFHARNAARATHSRSTMLTTATHDHKRGEDARARLAVLSEIPVLWEGAASTWLRTICGEIDAGDAYQLLQTLVGVWPEGDRAETQTIFPRVEIWARKFLREGKLRSSWTAPNEEYEELFIRCLAGLLKDAAFVRNMDTFIGRIAPAARANAIAQMVLRCCGPGMPDLYQGREWADFSLVDPDNRAAVDYDARKRSLAASKGTTNFDAFKQRVLSRLLHARAAFGDLFANGAYLPIEVEGARANHVIAFALRGAMRCTLVATALRCAEPLCGSRLLTPPEEWWSNTALALPQLPQTGFRDLVSGDLWEIAPSRLSTLLRAQPVAVLVPA